MSNNVYPSDVLQEDASFGAFNFKAWPNLSYELKEDAFDVVLQRMLSLPVGDEPSPLSTLIKIDPDFCMGMENEVNKWLGYRFDAEGARNFFEAYINYSGKSHALFVGGQATLILKKMARGCVFGIEKYNMPEKGRHFLEDVILGLDKNAWSLTSSPLYHALTEGLCKGKILGAAVCVETLLHNQCQWYEKTLEGLHQNDVFLDGRSAALVENKSAGVLLWVELLMSHNQLEIGDFVGFADYANQTPYMLEAFELLGKHMQDKLLEGSVALRQHVGAGRDKRVLEGCVQTKTAELSHNSSGGADANVVSIEGALFKAPSMRKKI